MPLAASDEHVRLAVAHPAVDLSALAPYIGDRRVELAIASRVELEAIVGPPRPVEQPAEEEPVAEQEPVAEELLIEEEPAGVEPAPVEVPAVEAEPEPEPEAEAEPVVEPEAEAEPEVEPEPDAEPEAEPEPPPVERYKAQPDVVPPDEEPSWLQAPRRGGAC